MTERLGIPIDEFVAKAAECGFTRETATLILEMSGLNAATDGASAIAARRFAAQEITALRAENQRLRLALIAIGSFPVTGRINQDVDNMSAFARAALKDHQP